MKYHFFDSASTTRCLDAAARLVQKFATEDFGNPSSSHAYGLAAGRAIRESRAFFATTFRIDPAQVIFTGSGTESDNLAVYGIALDALARHKAGTKAPRVLASATEHPAVRKTVQSLSSLGIDAQLIPVDSTGQIQTEKLLELLTPETVLVSIQQVNNIIGAIHPVEDLARLIKERVPGVIFHTDAVQAFGKVTVPTAPSSVDLVSISGHKINGPKGVGALLVLRKELLKQGFRPLVWGGDQEGGFRSGTQNAGLIAAFRAAAEEKLRTREASLTAMQGLKDIFVRRLQELKLLGQPGTKSPIQWNNPGPVLPHILSLSLPGYPSGPFAKLLEERGFLVSTGSACSSQKSEPDAVLAAMGYPREIATSAIRISFCDENRPEDVLGLADAFQDSYSLMLKLLGGGKR